MTRQVCHSWASLLSALAVCLLPAKGHADTIRGYFGQEKVIERSPEYSVSLRSGWATVTVRREIYNGGDKIDEAILAIRHPREAVAIGLRTKSWAPGAPWWKGILLDARIADARYRQLTGFGTAVPRDPAILYWANPETWGLQVFPCAIQKSQWVEYKVLIPTRFEEGKSRFDLAEAGIDAYLSKVSVRAEDPRDRLAVNDVEYPPGTVLTQDAVNTGTVDLLRGGEALRIRFASVGLKSRRSIEQVVLETAPKISEVPKNAQIVVLLDNSFSMEKESELSELYRPFIGTYLSYFANAKVAIVLFDRGLTEVTSGFKPADEAIAALKRSPKFLKNGSNLDAALERAAELFRGAGSGKPRRILLVTDALTRHSLKQSKIAELMTKTHAVVHVSSLSHGYPNLSESDGHIFQGAIEATGGLAFSATIPADSELDKLKNADGVFEELARPRHYVVEKLRIGRSEIVQEGSEVVLAEGQQWTHAAISDGGQAELLVQTKLWGRRPTFRRGSDRAEETLLAAEATTKLEPFSELTYEETRELAFRGGAVSPYTSYLAVEPGVRPSTAGIERTEAGEGIGIGAIGMGHGAGYGRGGSSDTVPFDPVSWLRTQIGFIRQACGDDTHSLLLSVETTRDEIVDLPKVEMNPRAASMEECVRSALWETQIPYDFSKWEHETWEVTVEAATRQ